MKFKYAIEDGRILIGKKKINPYMMRFYGFLIQFLSGVLIVNSFMGILQYKNMFCFIYLLFGVGIFYIGTVYKQVAVKALYKIKEQMPDIG